MTDDEDFDSSPRPVKKRRLVSGTTKPPVKAAVSKKITKSSKAIKADGNDDFESPATSKPKSKRGRPKKNPTIVSDDDASVTSAPSKRSARGKKAKTVVDDSDEAFSPSAKPPVRKTRRSTTFDSDEDGSAVSVRSKKSRSRRQSTINGIDDDDDFVRPQKPKHAIHITAEGYLEDRFLDANAPPPSTNPWEIRGAIWKRDAPKGIFDNVHTAPKSGSPGAMRPPVTSTSLAVSGTARSARPNNAVISTLPSVQPSPPASLPTRAAIEPSDIPNSDDLDMEDWAHLYERPKVPPARTVNRPAETAHNSSLKHSIAAGNLPVSTEVPVEDDAAHPELVEDSILIDELDAEDWSMLEHSATEPLARNAAVSEHREVERASSNIQFKALVTNRSPQHPSRTLGKRGHHAPFIDIDDDLSDEEAFANAPLQAISSKHRTELAPDNPRSMLPQKAVQSRKGLDQVRNSALSTPAPDELVDLPSDAFDSDSSMSFGELDQPIVAQAQLAAAHRVRNLAAPKSGLVQTTLFGSKAPNQPAATMTNKKHAWPLATQQEPATHHALDLESIKTWVYPTNLGSIRDYQYNIVARGLFHNLLVALPTGLGKTFIAATVMLNWFRWAPKSQMVFVAPTKPLVAQQIDACFNIVGIPRSETVLLTGETKPAIRAEEWKEKRVFFMTPQTIMNDLKHGYCDPKRIVLVVVDEAHRATGGYAYVELIKFLRRFNQSFRVLALTATPGSTVEAVQEVIDGLDISRVEIRTERSIDITQYVHEREIDAMKFDYSDEMNLVMELLSKAIQPVLSKLNGQNAFWNRDPMKLTAFGCTIAQREWSKSEPGRKAPQAIKGMVVSIFSVLSSLAHGISLLKFHGIVPFYHNMCEFQNEVDGGQNKKKYAKQIREDQNFRKLMGTVQSWVRNPEFLGHPKLEYLRSVVLNHFLDSKDQSTRIMIFAHWRDSAEEIVRVMNRNQPMIRAHVFVGQAASKGSEGMNQKLQLNVIEKFKDGTYNTLVATSIGEEGLDIGEVDLIVCYDASSSPIRMLQRMGRTGRKRKGKIAVLLMKDKEAVDFEKAKDNYEKMQAMISEGSRFTFHDDKSPRILPRGVNPSVDKRVVEIPVENSQADLPEPNKRKRVPKKPPKKFHMPDNVRTGFVNASRMDASDEEEAAVRPKAKTTSKKIAPASKLKAPIPEPEAVPLPFVSDITLSKVQERELERKYQYVNGTSDGALTVGAPKLDSFTSGFPGPSRLVKHSERSLAIANTMRNINNMDSDRIRLFKNRLRLSDLTDSADNLLGEPESDMELPRLPTLPTHGSKNKATAASRRKTASKPASRAAKRRTAARRRNDSSEMEGDESEPEPTPANMRIGTQGIDLGSDDTMGEEDEDGEPDSELNAFVVGSDAPIEMISSSLPRMRDEESEDEDDIGRAAFEALAELSDSAATQQGSSHVSLLRQPVQRRRRAVVDDSDD
ncbi:hypothetical protein AAFC00_000462 [Neodothiora populina]|uniref:ATP-dependent DNA helicase n=1 Tax=Neodothiora populina TaxID=2781224 RepID=A0ABR3PD14_9PEZI